MRKALKFPFPSEQFTCGGKAEETGNNNERKPAMMTAANTVIIIMQNIPGLGETARMNRPGAIEGN